MCVRNASDKDLQTIIMKDSKAIFIIFILLSGLASKRSKHFKNITIHQYFLGEFVLV